MTKDKDKPTVYIKSKNSFQVANFNLGDISSHLPLGVYRIKQCDNNNFKLEILDDEVIQIPKKLYGNFIQVRTKTIVNRFKRADKNLGVLLSGDKGSGKSLLLNSICQQMLDQAYPIIISDISDINVLKDAILSSGSCVFVFDEFGKNINIQQQDKLLTVFDGINNNEDNKKLFLFTENSVHNINRFMLNRPSRILYHFKFTKLPKETVEDYLTEYKVSELFKTDLLNMLNGCRSFSFDDLQSLTDEHLHNPAITLKDMVTYINCNSPNMDGFGNNWKISRMYVADSDVNITKFRIGRHEYAIGSSMTQFLLKNQMEIGQYPFSYDMVEFIDDKDEKYADTRLSTYKVLKQNTKDNTYFLISSICNVIMVIENSSNSIEDIYDSMK